MQDRPSAIQLLDAVQRHLSDQVIPALEDPGRRFRTLVAANVLAVVARELQMASGQAPAEWKRLANLLGRDGAPPVEFRRQVQEIENMNQVLCREIEAGAFDAPDRWKSLIDHCQQTAREKLAVANPRFLEKIEREVN